LKKGYAVAAPDIERETVVAFRGPLEASLPKLAEMGYDGVELVVKRPASLDAGRIAKMYEQCGLEAPLICTGEAYGEDGLAMASPQREIRERGLQRMKEVVEFAGALGAMVNIGRVRGQYCKGTSRAETERWAEHAFAALIRSAEKADTTVLIEPINRFQCNFIMTTQEGLQWVERMGSDRFQLMVDLFHMNIEDRSLRQSLLEAGGRLKHVHVCDSNRRAPGQGHIDFEEVIGALKEADFQAYLSGEVLNVPDDETAARRTIEFLRKLI